MATKRRRRSRRSQAQLFLDALKQLGGSKQLIGNKMLRTRLGWDENRYRRVRVELVDQKKCFLAEVKVEV